MPKGEAESSPAFMRGDEVAVAVLVVVLVTVASAPLPLGAAARAELVALAELAPAPAALLIVLDVLGEAPFDNVAVDEGVPVLVPLPVPLCVPVPVAVGVLCALLVTEPDAPRDKGGVEEAVTVGEGLPVAETVAGGVPVGEELGVAVPVALTVLGGLALPLCETLPEADGAASCVRESLGEALSVELALRVGVGESEPVLVEEGVELAVAVGVGD